MSFKRHTRPGMRVYDVHSCLLCEGPMMRLGGESAGAWCQSCGSLYWNYVDGRGMGEHGGMTIAEPTRAVVKK